MFPQHQARHKILLLPPLIDTIREKQSTTMKTLSNKASYKKNCFVEGKREENITFTSQTTSLEKTNKKIQKPNCEHFKL